MIVTSANVSPWARFSQDPRSPAAASLRASDSDRNVALEVLGEGYADGRLDKEEYDVRATTVTTTRTLGELPGIIADLVPEVPARWAPEPASPEGIQTKAVHTYEASRRNAISGMVIPSVITIVIWFAIGWDGGVFHPGFPWPLFVLLGTGVNLLRVLLHRQDIIAEEQQRLERKQHKELGGPKQDS